ncbi:MAG: hypothetical protein LBH01_04700 [Verrucomicrobiales bacterium]|jgi:uncharacterized protein (TIGR02598 family)|nr:hypothetical protein [Verrucomicrobiales bacterium]
MKNYRPDKGFSLVEVVLALGVASFALLAIIGMLPVGVNTQQDSMRETIATNIGTAIINDLNQVPGESEGKGTGNTKSSLYQIEVNATEREECFVDENGKLIAPSTARPTDYKVVVNLIRPASGRSATCGTVDISWPATAAKPLGSVTLFVSLDRN